MSLTSTLRWWSTNWTWRRANTPSKRTPLATVVAVLSSKFLSDVPIDSSIWRQKL
jgi:hypothetical protein